jgi:hypothetical protein
MNSLFRAFILLLLLVPPAEVFSWRAFSRFPIGADANGVGDAYVGDASDDTAAFYNPAGLVQCTNKLDMNWDATTGIAIQNVFDQINVRLDRLDTFSFFGLTTYLGDWHFATALSTEFFSSFNNATALSMRVGSVCASYPILSNLSIGIGIGPVFGFEGTTTSAGGWGISWAWNAGVLWKPTDELQFGACYHSGFDMNWYEPVGLVSLDETYPALFEAGGVWKMSKRLFLDFGADWLFVDEIRYIDNGVDDSPKFGNNLFTWLHPHIGIRFLEPVTGAHLSVGFMTDNSLFDGGNVPQYLLTAGFRFYGRNVVFSGSLIDAVLIGMVYSGNAPDERINVEISYKFM